MIKNLILSMVSLLLFVGLETIAYADEQPVEHWMLLDASASLSVDDAKRRNDAAWNKAATLLRANPKDLIGVAAFGCEIVGKPLSPTDEIQVLKRYIMSIGRGKSCTNIEGALSLVLKEANTTDKKMDVYLFTDGRVDVPPKLSSNAGRDYKDLASENRIRAELIPALAQRDITVNVIALRSESLDEKAEQLLEEIVGGTSGVYRNTSARYLLPRLFEINKKGLQARVNEGAIVYLNENYAIKHDLLGPIDSRIEILSGDVKVKQYILKDKKRFEIDLKSSDGTIQVVDSNKRGIPKENIIISTTSKIIAEPFMPLPNKINFFQNEVVLFKMKLRPDLRHGSQKIFDTIKSKVDLLVKISGTCQDRIRLNKSASEEGEGEKRGIVFKGEWWLTRCYRPGEFNYEFVVIDKSNKQNYYEVIIPSAFSGYSMVGLPSDLGQWELESTSGDADVFKNLAENTYFTGGKLKVKFKYLFSHMPISDNSQRLLEWDPNQAEYFMDDVKLKGSTYDLTGTDIGKKVITCLYNATEANSLNTVKLKFQKEIRVANVLFSIQPVRENMGIHLSNEKEFSIPFRFNADHDISLAIDLEDSKLPIKVSEESKFISLKKGESGLKMIKIITADDFSGGKQVFRVTFSNSELLKRPLSYRMSLEIIPFWWLIAVVLAGLFVCLYLFSLLYWTLWWKYRTSDARKKPWAGKLNINGVDEMFQLKLLIPERQITIKNREADPVYLVKVKFFGGIKIVLIKKEYKLLLEQQDNSRNCDHLRHIHLADSIQIEGSSSINFDVRINPGKNGAEVMRMVNEQPELFQAMQQDQFLRY